MKTICFWQLYVLKLEIMILMLIFNVDFSDQGTEVREALQHRSLRMYLIIFSKYFTDWWI